MGDQEDIDTLRLFNDKVEKLFRGTFNTQAGQGVGAMLEWREGEGWESIHIGPNEESVDAIALTLRFFIQDNESTSLHNMAALYSRLTVACDLRKQWLELRQRLNDFLDSPTNIALEETKRLSHRQVLELFMYGSLSHANPTKARTMEMLSQTPMFPILQTDFVQVVTVIIRILERMRMINRDIIQALR